MTRLAWRAQWFVGQYIHFRRYGYTRRQALRYAWGSTKGYPVPAPPLHRVWHELRAWWRGLWWRALERSRR